MIAQKTRYALRSLLFLAEEQGGAPVQLGRIAETQRVPPKYLELIMLDLKKAGLVKSARGPKGGYSCRAPAEQISFGEVVRTMEGPIALVSCASINFYAPCGDCQDEATCAIRRAFAILRDQSTAVLDSISLAQGAAWEERLGDRNRGRLAEKADPAVGNRGRRQRRCAASGVGCAMLREKRRRRARRSEARAGPQAKVAKPVRRSSIEINSILIHATLRARAPDARRTARRPSSVCCRTRNDLQLAGAGTQARG